MYLSAFKVKTFLFASRRDSLMVRSFASRPAAFDDDLGVGGRLGNQIGKRPVCKNKPHRKGLLHHFLDRLPRKSLPSHHSFYIRQNHAAKFYLRRERVEGFLRPKSPSPPYKRHPSFSCSPPPPRRRPRRAPPRPHTPRQGCGAPLPFSSRVKTTR